MKKIYLFGIIASAALAMTSCSSDETTENVAAQGNVIEFGTYLGRDAQTRGTVLNDDALENMGVYASYTNGNNFNASTNTPNFMYNQKVTKENSAWSYSPLKYWPTTNGDKVSFFAYAPYTGESRNVDNNGTSGDELNSGSGNSIITTNSTNNVTGAPTLKVTLPSDLTKMVDFVAGVQMNQTHTKTGNDNEAVNFKLKHELTRVGMKAKVSQNVYYSDAQDAQHKTKVVITGIKLDKATSGQFYESGVYTFPTSENSRGTWEGTAATKDFDLGTLLAKTNYSSSVATYNKEGIILTGTEPVSLFTNTEYLFLIPASNETGNGLEDGKATATISYDIVTEDKALADGYSVSSATKTVKIPSGTLKQGKAYTLTFTINVDEVKLSAAVNNWDEEDQNGNQNVDYKDNDVTTQQ